MPELRGVLGRVRRDRQVSNLLYGLLGYEDESDPQAAIGSLAAAARATLEGSGPEYLERVAGAAQLLIEMVLDVARSDRDRAVRAAVERAADVVLGPELERRTGMTGIRALPAGDEPVP